MQRDVLRGSALTRFATSRCSLDLSCQRISETSPISRCSRCSWQKGSRRSLHPDREGAFAARAGGGAAGGCRLPSRLWLFAIIADFARGRKGSCGQIRRCHAGFGHHLRSRQRLPRGTSTPTTLPGAVAFLDYDNDGHPGPLLRERDVVALEHLRPRGPADMRPLPQRRQGAFHGRDPRGGPRRQPHRHERRRRGL